MDMSPVVPFVAVAVGGALGALSRFCVYRAVETAFPWATFIVNIVGCYLASFLMFRYGIYADGPMKMMVFTGFFGAFTTMSTFSIDTVNLLCDGQYWNAGGNIVLNSVVCVSGPSVEGTLRRCDPGTRGHSRFLRYICLLLNGLSGWVMETNPCSMAGCM